MNKEISSNIATNVAFKIQEIVSNTTTAGEIIDTADYDGGASFFIQSGTLTDGTYTPLIEEGDDSALSDAAAVADIDLYRKGVATGQEANAVFALTDDDEIHKLAYIGTKRYIRLSIVSAATSSGGFMGAIAVKDPEIKDVGDGS